MDPITFLGARVPLEVKKLFSVLPKLKPELLKPIFLLVVSYIKGVDISEEDFEKISNQLKLDKASLSVVFTGLFLLFRGAIKSRVKQDQLTKDLQELRVPEQLAQDLQKTLKGEQASFEEAFSDNRIRFPSLEDFRWRVDVNISSNSISRIVIPSILVEFTSSDGNVRTVEMTVEKFQELRYEVVKVLKEMSEVEKHPILKLN